MGVKITIALLLFLNLCLALNDSAIPTTTANKNWITINIKIPIYTDKSGVKKKLLIKVPKITNFSEEAN